MSVNTGVFSLNAIYGCFWVGAVLCILIITDLYN